MICTKNVLLFKIIQVICDALIKSFLLNIKLHNTYHKCNFCIEKSSFINHYLSFVGIHPFLWINKSFQNKLNDDCYKDNFLLNILILIFDFYMLDDCLGVIIYILIKELKPNVHEMSSFIREKNDIDFQDYLKELAVEKLQNSGHF